MNKLHAFDRSQLVSIFSRVSKCLNMTEHASNLFNYNNIISSCLDSDEPLEKVNQKIGGTPRNCVSLSVSITKAASNARAVGDSEAARRRSMRAGQTFSGWQGHREVVAER